MVQTSWEDALAHIRQFVSLRNQCHGYSFYKAHAINFRYIPLTPLRFLVIFIMDRCGAHDINVLRFNSKSEAWRLCRTDLQLSFDTKYQVYLRTQMFGDLSVYFRDDTNRFRFNKTFQSINNSLTLCSCYESLSLFSYSAYALAQTSYRFDHLSWPLRTVYFHHAIKSGIVYVHFHTFLFAENAQRCPAQRYEKTYKQVGGLFVLPSESQFCEPDLTAFDMPVGINAKGRYVVRTISQLYSECCKTCFRICW